MRRFYRFKKPKIVTFVPVSRTQKLELWVRRGRLGNQVLLSLDLNEQLLAQLDKHAKLFEPE